MFCIQDIYRRYKMCIFFYDIHKWLILCEALTKISIYDVHTQEYGYTMWYFEIGHRFKYMPKRVTIIEYGSNRFLVFIFFNKCFFDVQTCFIESLIFLLSHLISAIV